MQGFESQWHDLRHPITFLARVRYPREDSCIAQENSSGSVSLITSHD